MEFCHMPIVTTEDLTTFIKNGVAFTEAETNLLALIQPMAESAVKGYLRSDIGYAQHVEYLPNYGRLRSENTALNDIDFRPNVAIYSLSNAGSATLALSHTPVWLTDIEVSEDTGANAGQSAAPFAENLTLGVDYWLDIDTEYDGEKFSTTGILTRFGIWPTEPRSVRVTYYGGVNAEKLAAMSGDLKLATMQTIAAHFWQATANISNKGKGTYSSESIGKYSYSLNSGGSLVGQIQGSDLPFSAKMLLQRHRSYKY